MHESRPSTRILSARTCLARASRVFIPLAVLLAALYEWVLHALYMQYLDVHLKPDLVGGGGSTDLGWFWLNDRIFVIAVGLTVLLGALLLLPCFREKPEVADSYFCTGGLCVLLAGVAGYLVALPAHFDPTRRLPGRFSETFFQRLSPTLFITLLWTMAAVAVMIALSRRACPLNASIVDAPREVFYGKLLRRMGISLGVGSALVVGGALYCYGLQTPETLEHLCAMVSIIYGVSFLVSVSLTYLILSVQERRAQEEPSRRLLGRADIIGFVSAAVATLLVQLWRLVSADVIASVLTSDKLNTLSYALLRVAAPALTLILSGLTLSVILRLLTVLRCSPLAHAGGMTLAVCSVVATVGVTTTSSLLQLLLYIDTSRPELYQRLSGVPGIVSYAVALASVIALIALAVGLRRGTTVSRGVYALPILHALPTVLSLLSSLVMVNILKHSTDTVASMRLYEQYTRIVQAVTILLSVAYTLTLACVLARAEVKDSPADAGDPPLAPVSDAQTPTTILSE